ncbi:unnamed protein product [Taenia asiatica]|uniref:Uncharacterized protein n=1 Tax=Taenia asiatica TaxID=60517 RepID=A0A0R3WA76_TAEAS|nr:unnamed protein product [Taenia asiatica]
MHLVEYHNIPSQQTADVEVDERRQSGDGNGTTGGGFPNSIRFPIRRSVGKKEMREICGVERRTVFGVVEEQVLYRPKVVDRAKPNNRKVNKLSRVPAFRSPPGFPRLFYSTEPPPAAFNAQVPFVQSAAIATRIPKDD